MNRYWCGKILLTFVLVAQSVSGFVLDWSPNHLLNPRWHPHARFHGALLLFLLSGVSAVAVWLLWRKSNEPKVAVHAAALISAAFWTPFFYITLLLPGSSPWASDPAKIPQFAGHLYYPNMVVAAAFLMLTFAAWRLSVGGSPDSIPGQTAPPEPHGVLPRSAAGAP